MAYRAARQIDGEVIAMDGLVYRQVHSNHLVDSHRASYMGFNPLSTGGAEARRLRVLSAYDGGQVSPQEAYRHYTSELGGHSVGVLAVSVEECAELGIEVDYDGSGFPAHVSLRFPLVSRSATIRLARQLVKLAMARGW